MGAHSRIHTTSIVDLSSELPLVIEWVDDPARVTRVMPRLTELVAEDLITCQQVEVVSYGHRRLRALRAAAPVRDLMSREVRTVRPDAPIAEAVEMLIGQAYRSLPVVDGAHRIVGILTDGDLLARLGLPDASVQSALTSDELGCELDAGRRSGKTVADLMVSPVVTTTKDAAISQECRDNSSRRILDSDLAQPLQSTHVRTQCPLPRSLRSPPGRRLCDLPPGTAGQRQLSACSDLRRGHRCAVARSAA